MSWLDTDAVVGFISQRTGYSRATVENAMETVQVYQVVAGFHDPTQFPKAALDELRWMHSDLLPIPGTDIWKQQAVFLIRHGIAQDIAVEIWAQVFGYAETIGKAAPGTEAAFRSFTKGWDGCL